jgi:hypothetical protein
VILPDNVSYHHAPSTPARQSFCDSLSARLFPGHGLVCKWNTFHATCFGSVSTLSCFRTLETQTLTPPTAEIPLHYSAVVAPSTNKIPRCRARLLPEHVLFGKEDTFHVTCSDDVSTLLCICPLETEALTQPKAGILFYHPVCGFAQQPAFQTPCWTASRTWLFCAKRTFFTCLALAG